MPSNARHCACIKKDVPSDTWYFLDSIEGFRVQNQPHAIAMKDSDWGCLRGQFSVAAGIDPYLNGALGFVPRDQRRYDVPQYFPNLRLTRLDQLRIQTTPQRLPQQRPHAQPNSATMAASRLPPHQRQLVHPSPSTAFLSTSSLTIARTPQKNMNLPSTHQHQQQASRAISTEWETIPGPLIVMRLTVSSIHYYIGVACVEAVAKKKSNSNPPRLNLRAASPTKKCRSSHAILTGIPMMKNRFDTLRGMSKIPRSSNHDIALTENTRIIMCRTALVR
jgi:hypothetical protein